MSEQVRASIYRYISEAATLLEVADEDHRAVPAKGELANLRPNALSVRTGALGKYYSTDVRNLVSALCPGLAAAMAISAVTHNLVDASVLQKHGGRDAGGSLAIFGPFAGADVLIFLLWIAAFVASLDGLRSVTRWPLFATLPASLVVWILEDHMPHLLWVSSSALGVYALFVVIATIGTPRAAPRNRLALSVVFGASLLSTAVVGLASALSLFAQAPQFVAEYPLGGGRALSFVGADQFVVYDRLAFLRPYDAWFVVAIPAILVAAGILNRLGHRTLADALLVLLIPMGFTLAAARRSEHRRRFALCAGRRRLHPRCCRATAPLRTSHSGRRGLTGYSHSMVPGGFDVTSSTTRLTPGTSLVMRFEMRANTS